MRWVLSLLVAANVFVFALLQGWLAPWIRGEREPQRLAAQREPERLRVVPLDRLRAAPGPAASSPRVSPSAVPPATPAQSPSEGAPQQHAAASAPGGAPVATCAAFGPMDEQRANRLREALEAAGAIVEATRTEQASSYLVYVPPAASLADAQRRMAALRRIGQEDVFLMQEGPLRLGISVGLFRSPETARALVLRLESLGETGVLVAPRGPFTTRVRLQARWSDPAAAGAATASAARFDTQARECN